MVTPLRLRTVVREVEVRGITRYETWSKDRFKQSAYVKNTNSALNRIGCPLGGLSERSTFISGGSSNTP